MGTYILNNFKGATVTIAMTGLPVLITGEVVGGNDSIVSLRLKNSITVYVEASLIAFVY